jgi:hypothetical protein
MNEAFLSFLWQLGLYNSESLFVDGEKIVIVHPGMLNRNAGPDFFNAKIKIGETLWVGNVEIHVKASDWYLHNHDKNASFDNVVLHVTSLNDQQVFTSKGRAVPTIELNYDSQYLYNYDFLMGATQWVACSDRIPSVNPFLITSLLSKLGVERLESHSVSIEANLHDTCNNWEESLYRQIARGYGFHINSQPFESLAKFTPFIVLKKYAGNLMQLEAILFGQAGLLEDDYCNDEYYKTLRSEYQFLKKKHNLQPMHPHPWKFMRLRPGNFPTVRIAQFAALIYRNPSVFSLVLEATSLEALVALFATDVSDYWHSHYTFGNESRPISKFFGAGSAKIIIINTVVPLYFVYGKMLSVTSFQDKAMQFLEEIEAEDNSVISEWVKVGVKPRNAFESQALLQLKAEYCDKKRCLECGIGAKIVTSQ